MRSAAERDKGMQQDSRNDQEAKQEKTPSPRAWSPSEKRPVFLLIGEPEILWETVAVGLELSGYTSIITLTVQEAMEWLTSSEDGRHDPPVIVFELPDQAMQSFLSFVRTQGTSCHPLLLQILGSPCHTYGYSVHCVFQKPFSIAALLSFIKAIIPATPPALSPCLSDFQVSPADTNGRQN